jgi:hypothetical protein
MNDIPLAPIGSIVEYKGRKYRISGDPIKPPCKVWNEAAKTIDMCLMIFDEGATIGIEFDNGMRTVLATKRFQKAIPL